MFTYQHIRNEIKQLCKSRPAAMIPSWVLDYMMKHIVVLPPGSIVVELGTFVGGTTVLMADANPTVIVHTYDINQFDKYEDSAMLQHMRDIYELPLLQATDIIEMQRLHLEDYDNIVMHVDDTTNIAETDIAVALVDDNRDEAALLNVLQQLWPKMAQGGVVLGDDIDSPEIYNAFAKFAKLQNIELTIYSKCVKLVKTNNVFDNRQFDFKDTLLHKPHIEDCEKI